MMNTTTYSLANESRQNLLSMYSDIHKVAQEFLRLNVDELQRILDDLRKVDGDEETDPG